MQKSSNELGKKYAPKIARNQARKYARTLARN